MQGFAEGAKTYLTVCIVCPYSLGLEVTREGFDLGNPVERFLDAKLCEALLRYGGVKQHAVVDLRSPPLLPPGFTPATSAPPHLQGPHLYTVQFLADYREVEIWHQGQRVAGVSVNGRASPETFEALEAGLRHVRGV